MENMQQCDYIGLFPDDEYYNSNKRRKVPYHSTVEIVDSRDNSSHQHKKCDCLMRAAIGLNGIPDIGKFRRIFHNQRQPRLSSKEKAQGLEALGSTLILQERFEEGLEYWKGSALLRLSAPRTTLPHTDLPPVTCKFFEPEWKTLDDLTRLLPKRTKITEMDQDKKLNLFYQAMLVRLAYCKSSNSRFDVSTLATWMHKMQETQGDVGVTFAKFALFVFEWDELHALHSLSLDDLSVNNLLIGLIRELTLLTNNNNTSHAGRMICCFDSLMVVLKWLATEFERAMSGMRCRLGGCFETGAYNVRQVMSLTICDTVSLSDWQKFEFQTCLKRILAADRRRGFDGLNLLLESCKAFGSLKNAAESSSSVRVMLRKYVRLLIEAGVDVNSTNKKGENCLHYLVDKSTRNVRDLPMFQFLLNSGARWDVN